MTDRRLTCLYNDLVEINAPGHSAHGRRGHVTRTLLMNGRSVVRLVLTHYELAFSASQIVRLRGEHALPPIEIGQTVRLVREHNKRAVVVSLVSDKVHTVYAANVRAEHDGDDDECDILQLCTHDEMDANLTTPGESTAPQLVAQWID